MSATMDVSDSPARKRRVRSMWTARSRSPSANQVSPPSEASAPMKFQLSSARPQPRTGSLKPASVYSTVSRSGETWRPRCSKSSAVLTATASAPALSTALRPSASFAPPTPPDNARTRFASGCATSDPVRCVVIATSRSLTGTCPVPWVAGARLRFGETHPSRAHAHARAAGVRRPGPSASTRPRRSRRRRRLR